NDQPLLYPLLPEPDGATAMLLDIPASLVPPEQPFLNIQFMLDQVHTIATDDRTLGIAVSRITIEPLP
ncbi:MAG TPA: hypothetical protein PKC19_01285, partial [Roseiflexaceae bacterium]|nr:hypothetical protein [Roseiflexaceae bacterium]